MGNQCLAETKAHSQYISEIIESNKKLIERFRYLTNNSTFTEWVIPDKINPYYGFNPKIYSTWANLFTLNLADATLDILNEDIENGLNKFKIARKAIDIDYNEDSYPSLISLMINIILTQQLDQTVNALLESGRNLKIISMLQS